MGLAREPVGYQNRTQAWTAAAAEDSGRRPVRGGRRRRLRWRGGRRGTAILALAAAVVLAAVGHARGAAGAPGSPAPSGVAAVAAARRVVVRPGDSLWGLGLRYAPPRTRIRRWVARVERLNGLPDADLHPGQVLVLPRG